MPFTVVLDTVFRGLQAFDGAVLGAGVGLLALKSLNSHRFYSAASEQVRAAPIVSVDGLRSLLSEEDGNGAGKGSPLVFVSGQVWPRSFLDFERGAKDPLLLSKGSSSRAVVIERSQTCMYDYAWGIFDMIFGLRSHFTELTRQYQSKSVETIPFVLTEDGLQPFKAFVVVNIDGSNHALPLTKAYHHLKPVQPSFLTFLHAFFHGKCPVGILDEERILPVGKMITAVGICSIRDGVPEITSSKDIPYFLSENSKDKIEAALAVKSEARLGLAVLLGIVSLGILGYSAWRNWTRWKSRSRRRQWLLEEAREADETESEVPDGQLCVVCLRKRRRSAFIPCGHLVCCSRCAHIIERDVTPLCPICRQTIRSSVWVYVH